jgi:hypothetical protein
MISSETNPDYIAPPGQMVRYRSVSKNSYDFRELNSDKMIMERMYQDVFKQLIEKGLFTVEASEDHNGFTSIQVSLDVRTPSDYGSPKWETIKSKNDFQR